MAIENFPSNCSSQISAISFDYGTHRIGVAFGQSISITTRSIVILKAKDGIPDWDIVRNLVEEWKPDVFVVGMPYNSDGTDGELLSRAQKFANRLYGRFGIPAFGMDEHLSSKAAITRASEQNISPKKPVAIDDIAAQIILESWLEGYRERSSKILK